MKRILTLCLAWCACLATFAQSDVLQAAQKTNDYFMQKYSDPTVPTNVNKIRPSSLWTRAVYYEGLMALNTIDPQQRYIDYAMRWADFHKWTPRNGVTTCDADDQCCAQTYVELVPYTKKEYREVLKNVIDNLDYQMKTPNTKKANGALYGWWTWIDAIQMAMPLYMQIYKLTGEKKYRDHALKMYVWSRDTCGGGLFNAKGDGLWWRDADYVPPYKEKDGKDCYWSRGNGWVYAALVRSMNELSPKDKAYKLFKKDFLLMSEGLLKCQHPDGFWHASLVSDCEYPDRNDGNGPLPLRHGMGHTARIPRCSKVSSGLRQGLAGAEVMSARQRFLRLEPGYGQSPVGRTARHLHLRARLRRLWHGLLPARAHRILQTA